MPLCGSLMYCVGWYGYVRGQPSGAWQNNPSLIRQGPLVCHLNGLAIVLLSKQ